MNHRKTRLCQHGCTENFCPVCSQEQNAVKNGKGVGNKRAASVPCRQIIINPCEEKVIQQSKVPVKEKVVPYPADNIETCVESTSWARNATKTPVPTPRTLSQSTPECDKGVPDYEYLQFSLRITEDIIRNDLYSTKDMQRVFNSHVEANRGRLSTKRMLHQIEQLCNELNINKNIKHEGVHTLGESGFDCNCEKSVHDSIKILTAKTIPKCPPNTKYAVYTQKICKQELVKKIQAGRHIITEEEIRYLTENDLQDITTQLLQIHDKNEPTYLSSKLNYNCNACNEPKRKQFQQVMTVEEIQEKAQTPEECCACGDSYTSDDSCRDIDETDVPNCPCGDQDNSSQENIIEETTQKRLLKNESNKKQSKQTINENDSNIDIHKYVNGRFVKISPDTNTRVQPVHEDNARAKKNAFTIKPKKKPFGNEKKNLEEKIKPLRNDNKKKIFNEVRSKSLNEEKVKPFNEKKVKSFSEERKKSLNEEKSSGSKYSIHEDSSETESINEEIRYDVEKSKSPNYQYDDEFDEEIEEEIEETDTDCELNCTRQMNKNTIIGDVTEFNTIRDDEVGSGSRYSTGQSTCTENRLDSNPSNDTCFCLHPLCSHRSYVYNKYPCEVIKKKFKKQTADYICYCGYHACRCINNHKYLDDCNCCKVCEVCKLKFKQKEQTSCETIRKCASNENIKKYTSDNVDLHNSCPDFNNTSVKFKVEVIPSENSYVNFFNIDENDKMFIEKFANLKKDVSTTSNTCEAPREKITCEAPREKTTCEAPREKTICEAPREKTTCKESKEETSVIKECQSVQKEITEIPVEDELDKRKTSKIHKRRTEERKTFEEEIIKFANDDNDITNKKDEDKITEHDKRRVSKIRRRYTEEKKIIDEQTTVDDDKNIEDEIIKSPEKQRKPKHVETENILDETSKIEDKPDGRKRSKTHTKHTEEKTVIEEDIPSPNEKDKHEAEALVAFKTHEKIEEVPLEPNLFEEKKEVKVKDKPREKSPKRPKSQPEEILPVLPQEQNISPTKSPDKMSSEPSRDRSASPSKTEKISSKPPREKSPKRPKSQPEEISPESQLDKSPIPTKLQPEENSSKLQPEESLSPPKAPHEKTSSKLPRKQSPSPKKPQPKEISIKVPYERSATFIKLQPDENSPKSPKTPKSSKLPTQKSPEKLPPEKILPKTEKTKSEKVPLDSSRERSPSPEKSSLIPDGERSKSPKKTQFEKDPLKLSRELSPEKSQSVKVPPKSPHEQKTTPEKSESVKDPSKSPRKRSLSPEEIQSENVPRKLPRERSPEKISSIPDGEQSQSPDILQSEKIPSKSSKKPATKSQKLSSEPKLQPSKSLSILNDKPKLKTPDDQKMRLSKSYDERVLKPQDKKSPKLPMKEVPGASHSEKTSPKSPHKQSPEKVTIKPPNQSPPKSGKVPKSENASKIPIDHNKNRPHSQPEKSSPKLPLDRSRSPSSEKTPREQSSSPPRSQKKPEEKTASPTKPSKIPVGPTGKRTEDPETKKEKRISEVHTKHIEEQITIINETSETNINEDENRERRISKTHKKEIEEKKVIEDEITEYEEEEQQIQQLTNEIKQLLDETEQIIKQTPEKANNSIIKLDVQKQSETNLTTKKSITFDPNIPEKPDNVSKPLSLEKLPEHLRPKHPKKPGEVLKPSNKKDSKSPTKIGNEKSVSKLPQRTKSPTKTIDNKSPKSPEQNKSPIKITNKKPTSKSPYAQSPVKTVSQIKVPSPSKLHPERSPSPTKLRPERSPSPTRLRPERSPSPTKLRPERSPSPSRLRPERSPSPSRLRPEQSPSPTRSRPEKSPSPKPQPVKIIPKLPDRSRSPTKISSNSPLFHKLKPKLLEEQNKNYLRFKYSPPLSPRKPKIPLTSPRDRSKSPPRLFGTKPRSKSLDRNFNSYNDRSRSFRDPSPIIPSRRGRSYGSLLHDVQMHNKYYPDSRPQSCSVRTLRDNCFDALPPWCQGPTIPQCYCCNQNQLQAHNQCYHSNQQNCNTSNFFGVAPLENNNNLYSDYSLEEIMDKVVNESNYKINSNISQNSKQTLRLIKSIKSDITFNSSEFSDEIISFCPSIDEYLLEEPIQKDKFYSHLNEDLLSLNSYKSESKFEEKTHNSDDYENFNIYYRYLPIDRYFCKKNSDSPRSCPPEYVCCGTQIENDGFGDGFHSDSTESNTDTDSNITIESIDNS